MSAGSKTGYNCKVTLGANQVLGVGTWDLSGIASDELDNSEFGDEWKTYEFGQKDGGSVKFSGLYKPTDTSGQETLRQANLENTDVTTLRLYVDNTSYYEPCQTTGYWSPSVTENASTQLSHVNVKSYNVKSDKSGLMQTDFECRISGVMVLV